MNEKLLEAIKENDINSLSELIKDGVNVSMITSYEPYYREKFTRPPLVYAVEKGYVEIVRALINAGADVNLKDEYIDATTLYSIFLKYYSIFQDYLPDHIVYEDIPQDNISIIMNMLLDAGADINELSWCNTTSLMNICMTLDIATPKNHNIFDKKIFINTLLDRGANINLQDKYGNTALMLTIHMLYEKRINRYCKLIINNYYGDPDEEFSNEIIHYKAHFVDLIKFLLSKGADIFIENSEGKTALDIAIAQGNQEIIDILTKAENKAKKYIAIKAYVQSQRINSSSTESDPPTSRFYHSKIDEPYYVMEQILNMAYGEDEEENEGAEESKSNRGDAGGRRRKKSKSTTRKSIRKKSRNRKSESKRRKSIRKKSGSRRKKSKSKRRK